MDKRLSTRKPFTAPVDFAAAGKPYQRSIADISQGGMKIRTKEHFEPGTVLTLCYDITEDIHIKTKGVVIRSGEAGLGVEFLKVGDSENP